MGFFEKAMKKQVKKAVTNALTPKPPKSAKPGKKAAPIQVQVVVETPAQDPAHEPLDYARLWKIKEPERYVLMAGDRIETLYVYDNRPLADVKVGQNIVLEAFRGDAQMTAQPTGRSWSTKDRMGVAFSYNGTIIGIAHLDKEEIRKAAKRGYAVHVAARCDGLLSQYGPGAKEINLYIGQRFDVDIPIEEDKARQIGAVGEIGCKGINLSDEEEIAPFATRNYWEFPNARLEFIPHEKKSKARENIGLYSEKGKLLMSVSPRRKLYEELVGLKDTCKSFYAFAYRETSYNGDPYYTVDLRYWQ